MKCDCSPLGGESDFGPDPHSVHLGHGEIKTIMVMQISETQVDSAKTPDLCVSTDSPHQRSPFFPLHPSSLYSHNVTLKYICPPVSINKDRQTDYLTVNSEVRSSVMLLHTSLQANMKIKSLFNP